MEYKEIDGVRYYKLYDQREQMSGIDLAMCVVFTVIILGLMYVGLSIIS